MTMTPPLPHAVGAPGYSETRPCQPESVGCARSLARAALHTWRLEALIDDGMLVMSELAGNAVQHSGCRLFRASITLTSPGHVCLAISDRSTALPRLQKAKQGCVTGRGLLLVDELADRWGTELRRWGKVAWANLVAGKSD